MRDYIKKHSGKITTQDLINHFGTVPVRNILLELEALKRKGKIVEDDQIVWLE